MGGISDEPDRFTCLDIGGRRHAGEEWIVHSLKQDGQLQIIAQEPCLEDPAQQPPAARRAAAPDPAV